ncbi:MAG: DUF3408 domain-containing protein [Rikenellaceae bacterium]
MRNNKKGEQRVNYNLFLQKSACKERCCVYVSKDVHEKISKVVNIIAAREVSIGGYIDAVLSTHLEQYKDEINERYAQQSKNLI